MDIVQGQRHVREIFLGGFAGQLVQLCCGAFPRLRVRGTPFGWEH